MIPKIDNKVDKIDQIQKQEIINSPFKIQPDDLFSHEQPTELNTDALTDLDRQLTKSSEPFSIMGISSIKHLFFEVGIKHVTSDQVQNFLNRLPRIEHLDYHQSTFEILQFLCDDDDFAKLIFASQVLNYINYSTFETVEDQIKTAVSDIIFKIVCAEHDAINSFMTNFFPYFYNNLVSHDFYADGGLATHLQLASKFICVIDDQNIVESIFKKFTLFIHHTDHRVISFSFEGLLYSIKYHNWLLQDPEFSSERLINRLAFLGGQKNEQTGSLVFIIFGHLICNHFRYPERVYKRICELIIDYMTVQEDIGRIEAITLIGHAFANPLFVESMRPNEEDSQFDLLMSSFLNAYDSFKLPEKQEAAYAFSNFFGFLPFQTIQKYVNDELFFDCLVDVLEFDDPEILIPLLNGLSRPLKANTVCFTISQKASLIDLIDELTKLSDELLVYSAEYIKKLLLT